jgi:hypothetical protein
MQYNLWSKHGEFNFLFLEIRKLKALFHPPQIHYLFIYIFWGCHVVKTHYKITLIPMLV